MIWRDFGLTHLNLFSLPVCTRLLDWHIPLIVMGVLFLVIGGVVGGLIIFVIHNSESNWIVCRAMFYSYSIFAKDLGCNVLWYSKSIFAFTDLYMSHR